MTSFDALWRGLWIIPYQELLGNYDWDEQTVKRLIIIPYQELLGNYDSGVP